MSEEIYTKIVLRLLLVWVAAFHLLFAASAGALWRDEANSIQQALLPGWGQMWNSLNYDSFPALYPALLRVFSPLQIFAGDWGLRLLGLITGLLLLAVIWHTARKMEGSALPFILVLAGSDPLLVSEGDSIRPYGIGLVVLLWAYLRALHLVADASWRSLALASLAAVLAVQSSYMNAFHIAVILTAAAIASATAGRPRPWLRLLPGCVAAASLIPYAGILREAREWASIVGGMQSWSEFIIGYGRTFSFVRPALWLAAIAIGIWGAVRARAQCANDGSPPRELKIYGLLAGLGLCGTQLALIWILHLPLFPRYFLVLVIFTSFPLAMFMARAPRALGAGFVALAIVTFSWPAWMHLRTTRTNVDRVAAHLTQKAGPSDLIVVSPWFLHTSFQRYYRGLSGWVTVPYLEPYPMMRYDLVRRAMQLPPGDSEVNRRLNAALNRGGAVWLVSQKPWTNLHRINPPIIPTVKTPPDGSDYVRLRSYWESDIEYRLASCCSYDIVTPSGPVRPVWQEENLQLTRWQNRSSRLEQFVPLDRSGAPDAGTLPSPKKIGELSALCNFFIEFWPQYSKIGLSRFDVRVR